VVSARDAAADGPAKPSAGETKARALNRSRSFANSVSSVASLVKGPESPQNQADDDDDESSLPGGQQSTLTGVRLAGVAAGRLTPRTRPPQVMLRARSIIFRSQGQGGAAAAPVSSTGNSLGSPLASPPGGVRPPHNFGQTSPRRQVAASDLGGGGGEDARAGRGGAADVGEAGEDARLGSRKVLVSVNFWYDVEDIVFRFTAAPLAAVDSPLARSACVTLALRGTSVLWNRHPRASLRHQLQDFVLVNVDELSTRVEGAGMKEKQGRAWAVDASVRAGPAPAQLTVRHRRCRKWCSTW
jgi:hypothetical protein